MNYAWNWGLLFEPQYMRWLFAGFSMTVLISLSAWIVALAIGTAVGIAGSLTWSVSRLAASAYINLFRNIPLLLQLFLWFFVVPELLPTAWGTWLKRELPNPEIWTSIIALSLFTAARVAVQVRAGIAAIPAGQTMAALAAGMSTAQSYRHVLLPQALRIVIAPLTSDFLTIFKNSALCLTIGVLELTAQSRQIESYTFHGFEAFTAATVLYVIIAITVTVLMRFVEAATAIPGTAATRGALP